MAQYKQLILDFEATSPIKPRKSMSKDAQALWPPGSFHALLCSLWLVAEFGRSSTAALPCIGVACTRRACL